MSKQITITSAQELIIINALAQFEQQLAEGIAKYPAESANNRLVLRTIKQIIGILEK